MPDRNPGKTDDSFRAADQVLQRDFAALQVQRQRAQLTFADYAAALHQLRDRELELFAAVRRHQFQDLAESNYWLRGRLKFPGRIEVELRSLHESTSGTVPR